MKLLDSYIGHMCDDVCILCMITDDGVYSYHYQYGNYYCNKIIIDNDGRYNTFFVAIDELSLDLKLKSINELLIEVEDKYGMSIEEFSFGHIDYA